MAEPTLLQTGFTGACPRCSAPTLFCGPTKFADRCSNCGLDYASYNVGDGPAAFLTLIIGALITALAITVELAFYPPFWVHVVLWIPITGAAVVYGLRLAKGMLFASEYKHEAREGRVDGKGNE